MPNLTNCLRCGSVLAAPARVRVKPPRAGKTKPFRVIRYWLNRHLGLNLQSEVMPPASPWPSRMIMGREEFIAAGLSVAPGLGHLLDHETRRLRFLWPAWLVMLCAGLALYGTTGGGLLLGAAIAAHAWIICDTLAIRSLFPSWRIRVPVAMAMFGLLLLGIYGGARAAAGVFVQGAQTRMDLPDEGIRAGDFVLVDKQAFHADAPRRGDIILYGTRAELRDPGYAVCRGESVGRIMGMPGERIVWKEGVIRVYGGEAVQSDCPSHADFASVELDFTVPEGQYFCLPPAPTMALGESGRLIAGTQAMTAYAQMMGFAMRPDIRGRVFVLYEPIERRQWVKRPPLPGDATP